MSEELEKEALKIIQQYKCTYRKGRGYHGYDVIEGGAAADNTLKLSSTKSFLRSAACVHVMAIILASFTNR